MHHFGINKESRRHDINKRKSKIKFYKPKLWISCQIDHLWIQSNRSRGKALALHMINPGMSNRSRGKAFALHMINPGMNSGILYHTLIPIRHDP